jgi:hypothetical protein
MRASGCTREPNSSVRDSCEGERPIRIADVHHEPDGQLGKIAQAYLLLLEVEPAFVHESLFTLRTGNGNDGVVRNCLGCVAAADYGGDTELACDDRGMARAAPTICDNRRGTLHDGLPVGVGHVGDYYVALTHEAQGLRVRHDASRSAADSLADAAALREDAATFFERKACRGLRYLTLHGLRTRLEDVETAVSAVFGPLYIHGPPVVLFDYERLPRELGHIVVVQREALPLGFGDIYGSHTLVIVRAVDDLGCLGAEIAAHDGAATGP